MENKGIADIKNSYEKFIDLNIHCYDILLVN